MANEVDKASLKNRGKTISRFGSQHGPKLRFSPKEHKNLTFISVSSYFYKELA